MESKNAKLSIDLIHSVMLVGPTGVEMLLAPLRIEARPKADKEPPPRAVQQVRAHLQVWLI